MLVVDPDAVLSFPVAAERLQAVAGRDQQIGERLSAIESNKAPKSNGSDAIKPLNPFTLEQPRTLPALEAPNHDFILLIVTWYVKRTTGAIPPARQSSCHFPLLHPVALRSSNLLIPG
jgi:hypothetical protein